MKNLLAFDLGASNGRAILGRLADGRLELRELHRFENNYVERDGTLCWDLPYLLEQMKAGLAAFRQADLGPLDCFGIDTWAVDYGLLDGQGRLLGLPRAYRAAVPADAESTYAVVDFPTLFARTGIASQDFNTVHQLYRRRREGDPQLAQAEAMLLMPDLLGYFLTGARGTEYTNATTTMLYSPLTGDWDWETIDRLGLPRKIFLPVGPSNTLRGRLDPALAAELGLNEAPFAAVGTHDTAAAVAAIPGEGSFAFCSSGTWSLFGVETDRPVLTDAVRDAGFSNEGTVQGGFRPLRNIMGLWIIQECRRDWQAGGLDLSWDDIVRAAEAAQPFRSIIDANDRRFFAGGDMPGKIRAYCAETGQPAPETVGQVARCVYESLALAYRSALEDLERIKGQRIDTLNITGGGIQNRLLDQMAADALDRPVVTGPVEGAAIGNLLGQAMALGAVGSVEELRKIVRASQPVERWTPRHGPDWERAYEKLRALGRS